MRGEGGEHRSHDGSCRPRGRTYFSFECDGNPRRFKAEERCDLVCVLTGSVVAEYRTDFQESQME